MKKTFHRMLLPTSLCMLVIATTLSSCNSDETKHSKNNAVIDSLKNQILLLTASNDMVAKNLAIFDVLDFTVFSNQQWTRLHESHSKDIKVHWPDGHITTGIDRHITDLKAMFVYAPNTSIKEHPIHFGSGNMTCVTGIMTGTFSSPMPAGIGQLIQPTGKSFVLQMCTVGIWKDGVMEEEYLFWDNHAYMEQIGITK